MTLRLWEYALRRAVRLAQRRPEVHGVDYGRVYKDGVPLKTLGIRFHLGLKRPPETLALGELLPRKLDDIRCDVLEARYSLQGNARGVCDPLQPGVSLGNSPRFRTGTLGMWVKDGQTGASGLLSNWHVLCGSKQAAAGDSISQPGPDHQGTQPLRVVAALERWVSLDVGIDAAMAVLAPGIGINATIFDQTLNVSGITPPKNGMEVLKYGVTSGLTRGMIDGIEGSYRLNYSAYGDTERWMDGIRIVVDPNSPQNEISLSGDSGAIWVEAQTGKAVALHFAGEDGLGPTAEYALAHPIGRVLDLLGIQPA